MVQAESALDNLSSPATKVQALRLERQAALDFYRSGQENWEEQFFAHVLPQSEEPAEAEAPSLWDYFWKVEPRSPKEAWIWDLHEDMFLAGLALEKGVSLSGMLKGLIEQNDTLEGYLYEAIDSGDLEQVERALGLGIDLQLTSQDGYAPAPLWHAVKLGNEAILDLLVDAGLSLSATGPVSKKHNTLLHDAISKNLYGMALHLLEAHHFNPNLLNGAGQSPLDMVLTACRKNFVGLLLDHGAAFDKDHLLEALTCKDAALLNLFFKAGAGAAAECPQYGSLLHFAIWDGANHDPDFEVVKTLVAHGARLQTSWGAIGTPHELAMKMTRKFKDSDPEKTKAYFKIAVFLADAAHKQGA